MSERSVPTARESDQQVPWRLAAPFLLALLTGLAYAGALRNGYVDFDDGDYVKRNPVVVQGLSWRGIVYAFTTFDLGNWIPVTWLSYELDVSLFGIHARAFHAMDLLLHVINVLLFYFLLLRLTGAFWKALVASALFAVHPLHVESVAWIAERKDLLSMFWLLVCLWCYLGYVRSLSWRWYLLALGALLLGLLSKSMLVTIPVLLLCLDDWPLSRFGSAGAAPGEVAPVAPISMWKLIAEKIPFAFFSLIIGIVTILAQQDSGAIQGLARIPPPDRIGNALNAYAWYVMKTFCPTGLRVVYSYPLGNLSWKAVGVSSLFLLLISLWVVYRGRRAPWLRFGWLWFLVSLLPVIGLLQVGFQSHADRYTYIPHLGLLVMIVWEAADFIVGRWHRVRLAAVMAVVSVVVCVGLTVRQVTFWKDAGSLWRRVLSLDQDDWYGNAQMGSLLISQNQFAAAREHLLKSVERNPNYTTTYANLGAVTHSQGDLEQAKSFYLRALELDPKNRTALRNLAGILQQEGELEPAVDYFLRFLEVDPGNTLVRNQLGLVYARQGHPRQALEQFQIAVRQNPKDALSQNNVGVALIELKKPDEAIPYFERALKNDPRYITAHQNLANLYEKAGQLNLAAQHYLAVLSLNPRDAQAAGGLRRLQMLQSSP